VIVDFTPTNPAAQIMTNIRRAGEDTQLLIDSTHQDWRACGLRHASAVNRSNLATIDRRDVTRRIGSLSAETIWNSRTAFACVP
jgi:hypothetical protein